MRSMFIVVCKVFGLVQLYQAATYVLMAPMWLPALREYSADSYDATVVRTGLLGGYTAFTIVSFGGMIVLTFVVAWLLICRAEWLADKVRIPASDDIGPIPAPSLVYAGTKLIGLLLVVLGISPLVEGFLNMQHAAFLSPYMWAQILPALLRVVIGLVLLLKTEAVVRFITWNERAGEIGTSVHP